MCRLSADTVRRCAGPSVVSAELSLFPSPHPSLFLSLSSRRRSMALSPPSTCRCVDDCRGERERKREREGERGCVREGAPPVPPRPREREREREREGAPPRACRAAPSLPTTLSSSLHLRVHKRWPSPSLSLSLSLSLAAADARDALVLAPAGRGAAVPSMSPGSRSNRLRFTC